MSEYLDGAEKQNALDFAAFCRANKMTPQWQSTNRWRFQHKGKRVCIVRLWDDSRSIIPYNAIGPWPEFSAEWEKFIFDEGLDEIVLENINHCRHCLPCQPGKDLIILGKECTNVCNVMYLFWNPDERTMECVKKLLEFRKQCIAAGKDS